MRKFSAVLVSVLMAMFMGVGCSGGGLDIPFDPADSAAKHQLNADGRGRVWIVPAVDHDQVVHVVRNGVETGVSVTDVSKIRLYYKPNWERSEVAFAEGGADMQGAPRRGEGTFSFITKSGEELWVNLDWVDCANGVLCQRSGDNLAIW